MLMANDDVSSYTHLFATLQLRRVIEAVAAVSNDLPLPRIPAELLDGNLDLLAREQSKAKDNLWELELFNTLRSNGI